MTGFMYMFLIAFVGSAVANGIAWGGFAAVLWAENRR